MEGLQFICFKALKDHSDVPFTNSAIYPILIFKIIVGENQLKKFF